MLNAKAWGLRNDQSNGLCQPLSKKMIETTNFVADDAMSWQFVSPLCFPPRNKGLLFLQFSRLLIKTNSKKVKRRILSFLLCITNTKITAREQTSILFILHMQRRKWANSCKRLESSVCWCWQSTLDFNLLSALYIPSLFIRPDQTKVTATLGLNS